MKKLSSDILFYQGLIGLIAGPILIFFFIKFVFTQSFPAAVIPFFYVLLGLLVIRGWYGVYKAGRISFDENFIYIENYFSKSSIQIPINKVVGITHSFNLNRSTSARKPYRITYEYDGKKTAVKFYKSLELYHVNDLENLIGLPQQKSVITNQGFIHNSDAIIAKSLKINSTTRITSAFMDHIMMTIVAMIFGLPCIIVTFLSKSTPKPDDILFDVALIGFALYFCKDCVYGQSIAKRLFKQQVVNNKTSQIASPLRCFIRDVFMIIWPIEVIAILTKPERRLGDMVAGTKVIVFDPALEKQRPNYLQLGLCFILSYAIMLAVSILSYPH